MMRPLLVVFALSSLTACLSEVEYRDPTQFAPQLDFSSGTALTFTGEGTLKGDIGPVHNFGAHPVTLSGFDDGTCTYVTIDGSGDDGQGTIVIDVMPRVDELAEGQHGIGIDDETFEGTSVSSQVLPASGDEYDGYADGGHVVMTKNPDGTRTIEVLARYSDTATQATSTFIMRPIGQ
jgi:hypothetical protein